MLRVLLLISVLYTAVVSGDESSSRYMVREEKFEFGSSALQPDGEQTSPYYESQVGGSDEYEYYPYEGYAYDEYDFDPNVYDYSLDIEDIMSDLEYCEEDEDGPVITEDGCIYFDDEGNVHLLQVFVDDIDDAYKMLEKAGLENCDMDGYKPIIPVGGCAYVSKDGGVHFMGVNKDDEVKQPETLPDVIGRVKPCKQIVGEPQVPAEGCVWFDDQRNIHLLNVLDDGNREDAVRVLHSSKLYRECLLGEDGPIVPKGGCIFVEGSSIHILGMQEHYVEHDDDENPEYDEDYQSYLDSGKDFKVSNLIKKAIERKTAGKTHLQKALFKRRSDDLAKKSIAQKGYKKKVISGQKARKTAARKPKSGQRSNQNTQRTSQNGPRTRPREEVTKSSYNKKGGNWKAY